MATFKSKMRYLELDWADKLWEGINAMNDGQGAIWRLAAAALAVTGARPASLERGITFSYGEKDGVIYIRCDVPGAKILKNVDGTARRGQDKVSLFWRATPPQEMPFRSKEFMAIANEMKRLRKEGGDGELVIKYDKDAIATNIRNLSKNIWPRKKYHVSPICYREMFSAQAKATGVDPAELAAAMGHLSAESQGKYQHYRGKKRGAVTPQKLFSAVVASEKVKVERAPMARFKASSANKARSKTTTLKLKPAPR